MSSSLNTDSEPFRGLRLAFVLPRYFAGIVGGAETLTASLARTAEVLGAEVEIWATCARDNRSWENCFEEGVDSSDGLLVRRFAVDERDLDLWIPRQIQLSEGIPLAIEDQFIWMEESVNSRGLYTHIVKHGGEHDLIFFAPYLFGTTFWGALLHPERSVLIPCLHDESNAYLDVVASLFRQVRGCLFNVRAEQQLARSIYGDQLAGDVVGMAFDAAELGEGAESSYFSESFPYVMYLGRMETGKNVHVLLDQFCEAKDHHALQPDLKLVIAGGGSFDDLHRAQYLEREDIVVVGRVSEEEKRSLLRHLVALVQPSLNESFCIVMMEAWGCMAPVVVHEGCAVTKDHVVDSGGGLYFQNAKDLRGALQYLCDHPAERLQMGEAGNRYLTEQYSWSAVANRFVNTVRALLSPQSDRDSAEGVLGDVR